MFQNLHRSLPQSGGLKIECDGCGRQTTWSRAVAMEKLGSHAAPADIRRRLRCKNCGKAGQAKTWI
jgi:ribosomal protein S27E